MRSTAPLSCSVAAATEFTLSEVSIEAEFELDEARCIVSAAPVKALRRILQIDRGNRYRPRDLAHRHLEGIRQIADLLPGFLGRPRNFNAS